MTARDWHGVLLPPRVCEQLDDIVFAMRATIGDPDAPPVRVLLWGPPGVGKTEIMRAVVQQAGLLAVSAAPADLAGAFIGQTSLAVKNLFARMRAQAPTLLLIDAVDYHFAADARYPQQAERCAAFLAELDDVRPVGAVSILGEAHDPRKIDRAVLAREFRLVEIPLPDEEIRCGVLQGELRKYGQHIDPDATGACAELAAVLDGKSRRDLVSFVRRVVQRAVEQAMTSDRSNESIVVSRDLFFADEMVVDARPRFGTRSPTANASAAPPISGLDDLHLTIEGAKSTRQFVMMIRNRQQLLDHGITPPPAILIGGPAARAMPVARAIALESGLPAREYCGSEVLVRECAEPGTFRRALADALAAAPCAVVVSDVERMLPRRGSSMWSRAVDAAVAELWTSFRLHLDTLRRNPATFVPLFVTSDDLDTLDESIAVRIPLRVWTDAEEVVRPAET